MKYIERVLKYSFYGIHQFFIFPGSGWGFVFFLDGCCMKQFHAR